MKNAAFTFLFIPILLGCGGIKKTYTLYHVQTGQRVTMRKQSPRPEEVVDLWTNRFRMITARTNGFELKHVRYDGVTVRNVRLPLFSKHVARWYGLVPQEYAISGDETRIAFFDLNTAEVKLADAHSGTERVLVEGVTTNGPAVAWLQWRSGDELLFAISGWCGDRARVGLVNVSTGSVFDLPVASDAWYMRDNFSLSRGGRYLAYAATRGGSPTNVVIVYDLDDRTEVGHFASRKRISQGPFWGDGLEFVYLDGSDLMWVCLGSNQSKPVRSFSARSMVYLEAFERGLAFYMIARKSNIYRKRLFSFDIERHQEHEIQAPLEGHVYISPGGEMIVSGWGY